MAHWKSVGKLQLIAGKVLLIAEAALTVVVARDTEGRPSAVQLKKEK
jgi:hypothetical protein